MSARVARGAAVGVEQIVDRDRVDREIRDQRRARVLQRHGWPSFRTSLPPRTTYATPGLHSSRSPTSALAMR